jgi:hypothetical protein
MPDTEATYLLAITVDSDARLRAGVAGCLKCLGKRAGIRTGPLVRLPDAAALAERAVEVRSASTAFIGPYYEVRLVPPGGRPVCVASTRSDQLAGEQRRVVAAAVEGILAAMLKEVAG